MSLSLGLRNIVFLGIVYLGIVFCLHAKSYAYADDFPMTLEALDAAVAEKIQQSTTPGAIVVLVENGEIVMAKGYGHADLSEKTPMTADTVLSAGSLSKNLTSLGMLRMVEQGKLSLKDRLAGAAPEISIDNPWVEKHPIRIEHLLEHTAGIEGSTYNEYAFNADNMSPKEYANRMAGKIKVRWPPGFFYAYANPGHTLAAVAMENACGCSFDEYMKGEVFAPLGMADSTFVVTDDVLASKAKSYKSDGATETSFWQMAIRPSGSLLTTANDLGRLVQFYATRGAEHEGFISDERLIRMENAETSAIARAGVVEGGYSLGNFGFFARDGVIFHGHTGSTDGFRTWLGYDPDTGAGFAVVTNGGDGGMRFQLMRLLGGYLTRDYDTISPLPNVRGAKEKAVSGWYAPFTHDMPFRAWLWKTFGAVHISVDDEGVSVAPLSPTAGAYRMLHTGEGLFRMEDHPVPLAGFVDGPSGEKLFVFGESYAPTSAFAVLGRFIVMAGGLVFGALALVHTICWAPMRFLGRLPSGPGVRLRFGLFLSGASLIVMFGVFVSVGLLGALEDSAQFGRIGLLSLSFTVLSLIGPLGAALALYSLVSLPAGRTPLRVYGVVACLFLAAAWLYVALNGWVPFISWRV